MLIAEWKDYQGSLAAIVVANMVPVLGVLFLGWNAGHVLLLYWTENIAIGFYNVLKMVFSRAKITPLNKNAKFFIVPFFIVHFGMFSLGHLVFVGFLASMLGATLGGAAVAMAIGLVSLLVSHGYSFKVNYLDGGERDRLTPGDLMLAPYKRVVVMHVTIIAAFFLMVPAGFLTLLVGGLIPFANLVPVLVLIAVKTVVDGASHLFEHKRA
ncbi:DUF6498-containing protein [archaeon]